MTGWLGGVLFLLCVYIRICGSDQRRCEGGWGLKGVERAGSYGGQLGMGGSMQVLDAGRRKEKENKKTMIEG